MNMLELSVAGDPYFGDHLLSTSHFLTWLDDRGMALPANQQIKTYSYLQVCALLAEIEACALTSITAATASRLAANLTRGQSHFNPHAAQSIVADGVGDKWRDILIEALISGDLILLDYASKLPLPAPVKPIAVSDETRRYPWEPQARAFAVEICAEEIRKGRAPFKQAAAAKEVVVLMRNAMIFTVLEKEISYDHVLKALQPWTAPDEAREMVAQQQERAGKKKITGK